VLEVATAGIEIVGHACVLFGQLRIWVDFYGMFPIILLIWSLPGVDLTRPRYRSHRRHVLLLTKDRLVRLYWILPQRRHLRSPK
jgi:hypothetical protein